MSFNPPDTRDEIRDTLVFMGVPYKYEKMNTSKGHVFTFDTDRGFIAIYGPRFMKIEKTKYNSTYDLKRALMALYSDLI